MQDESLNAFKLGFGMLRLDVDQADHREALRDALLRGIDLFDLGDFATDPARFTRKENLLRGLVAEYATAPVRAIVRGNLGAADRFVSPDDPKIEWIYLVADPEFALPALEWDHHRLYSLLAHELDTLESLAQNGEIGGYGVGSAGFLAPKESPEALALEPLVDARQGE